MFSKKNQKIPSPDKSVIKVISRPVRDNRDFPLAVCAQKIAEEIGAAVTLARGKSQFPQEHGIRRSGPVGERLIGHELIVSEMQQEVKVEPVR